MDLVVDVYELTSHYPKHELYGLTSQTRRAALSIPSNIAEGNGRMHRREYAHHVSIARGSVAELVACLEVARRLGYIASDVAAGYLERADAISRMLLMLLRALDKPVRASR